MQRCAMNAVLLFVVCWDSSDEACNDSCQLRPVAAERTSPTDSCRTNFPVRSLSSWSSHRSSFACMRQLLQLRYTFACMNSKANSIL